jgi:hypothetical protein
VPTLVLASTADPVTPASAARAILARQPDARLVETQGGGHGSLGESCPNERMADFVVDRRLPVGMTSTCLGEAIDPFVPLARSPAVTAADAVAGALEEIVADPLGVAWDGTGLLTIGCGEGGIASLESTGDGWVTTVTMRGCAWATDVAFDGTGTLDLVSWDADIKLRSTRGDLWLATDGGAWHLTGDWDGRAVDEDL